MVVSRDTFGLAWHLLAGIPGSITVSSFVENSVSRENSAQYNNSSQYHNTSAVRASGPDTGLKVQGVKPGHLDGWHQGSSW